MNHSETDFNRRQFLRRASGAVVGAGASVAISGIAAGQTRKEVEVEMSDGVTLRGQFFYPTNNDGNIADGSFPVVLTMTPYNNEDDETGPSPPRGTAELVPHGYIRAEFEVRGSGGSGGAFQLAGPREQEDYSEIIDWLGDHPRSNGKVGMYGQSYRGLNQFLAARAAGPDSPLEALVPIESGVDPWYRDVFFRGGMWNEVFGGAWFGGLTAGVHSVSPALAADDMSAEEVIDTTQSHLAGGYQSGLSAILGGNLGTDRAYRERYWRVRSPEYALPAVVEHDIPVLTYQGWFDLLQAGPTQLYAQLQNLWAGREQFAPLDSDQPVSGRLQAVIGPWYHSWPSGLADKRARLWFDRFLKGKQNGIDQTDTPLHLFQVYGDRWVDARVWPLPDFGERNVETYYLNAGRTGTAQHTLNDGALGQSKPAASDASDTLPWRRHNPCSQGTNEEAALGATPTNACTDDERTFEAGALSYTTPPLDEGRNMAGPVSLSLFASADSTNTSWAVGLSTVAPDGTSRFLSKGELLGSFRKLNDERSWYFNSGKESGENGPPAYAQSNSNNSERRRGGPEAKLLRPHHDFTLESEESVEPGVVERYNITLDPMFARIPAGHRLRLTIRTTASWAQPLAKDLDDVVGTYQVQRNKAHASYINIPFVSGPLPESSTDWGPCSRNCGSPYRED